MTVRRIVSNLYAGDPQQAKCFYRDFLGLALAMDHGWIKTYVSDGTAMTPQVSFASQGGSDTPVPAISIEVDDLDQLYQRAQDAGIEIVYPLTVEPWGVRRFFARDPFGNIVNILSHSE
ncbi:VOC family protein [Devosia rhodophyticola]|uniref:VOC family protein n=1 Tax=Devosia rhodophyticola TaxID=3026423 RepID=A0ABY7YUA2_9HYPH|nr:VOC family protein [Devosia rhodophyticola]WDR04889.1 VOC family protein [Devosia rhodophyticola]